MRTGTHLALAPVLSGCSVLWAQVGPTLVVTGTGGTTHDFTGSYRFAFLLSIACSAFSALAIWAGAWCRYDSPLSALLSRWAWRP